MTKGLPSDWPSHGHYPRSEAKAFQKKRAAWWAVQEGPTTTISLRVTLPCNLEATCGQSGNRAVLGVPKAGPESLLPQGGRGLFRSRRPHMICMGAVLHGLSNFLLMCGIGIWLG